MFNLAQFNEWYTSDLGKQFHSIEQGVLDQLLPTIFGYHLLYIAHAHTHFSLKNSSIKHRILLHSKNHPTLGFSFVKAHPIDLPFANSSIDLVILPHILEFTSEPEAVLDEVCRVVIPDGHIILMGFNPYSLWGLRHMFSLKQNILPWRGQMLSFTKTRLWLLEQDFDIVNHQSYFYRPPVTQPKWLQRLEFMEKLGSACWSQHGAGYMMLAQKKVVALTPLKPHWQNPERLAAKKGIIETTNRTPDPL